jgi:hypothetical protein
VISAVGSAKEKLEKERERFTEACGVPSLTDPTTARG